jgi:N-methylhydantoinase A
VLRQLDLQELNAAWDRLVTDAVAQLTADGFTPGQMCLRRTANLHYQGQTFELTVPVPAGALDAPALAALAEAFGQEHERTYGHRAGPDEPVEIVTIQVMGQGLPDRPRVPDKLLPPDTSTASRLAARQAYFGPQLGWLTTPVLHRAALTTPHEGPCIIEEYDATCVVPPRARAALDVYGNMVIDLL